MNSSIQSFHRILWDHLSISEMGISNTIPQQKLNHSNQIARNNLHYRQIKTEFYDYGEHKHKYIWGDGISCLWEDNKKRTCYFPWESACSAWNCAKFSSPSAIHKIVIYSSNNQRRNSGLKIQASMDHTNWNTLYIINRFDVNTLLKGALTIYFSDNTPYLYLRIMQENTVHGYDIESIQVFAQDISQEMQNKQISLFYILNGCMTVNGLRYQAPFGFVKLSSSSFSVTANRNKNIKIFWISFEGNEAINLLEKAYFDLENPLFVIKNRTYLNSLNTFADEQFNNPPEENQFILISKFMNLLALHSKYHNEKSGIPSIQENYVIAALQFIDENKYHDISLGDIANHCAISEKYLIKIFKERMGTTPIQYLNEWKIQTAKKMLRTTYDSIETISQTLNFCSPEYFCRLFKLHEKCSPSQYRKQQRNSYQQNS